MGNALSGEVAEAKKIIADFTAAFAKNYAKLYSVGIFKTQKRLIEKQAAGNPWKLRRCDKDAETPVRKTGILLKRSVHLKKWNPRFFVVKGDWIADYYETEEKYKSKGKPLGSINFTCLTVIRDLNNSLLARVTALAEKVGLPVDQLPKPEKFPDNTMELYNERRESIYLQAKTPEEFTEFCDLFDKCRWWGPRLNITDDKIHRWAFENALWRTRWEVGMWGWWYSGGGEINMISDCINEQIAWQVMGKVDAKLKTPWAVRSRTRNAFIKSTSGAVSSGVTPVWKGLYDTVQKAKPTIADALGKVAAPIAEAQGTLQGKIMELVEAGAKDTLNSKVAPALGGLIDIVFAPVLDSFKLAIVAFENAVTAGKEKFEKREDHMHMVYHFGWTSDYWDAYRRMGGIYEPMWALRAVFDDVSPWRVESQACRRMRKIYRNALFTFEHAFEELKDWDLAFKQTRELMVEDCKMGAKKVLGYVLFGVVSDFWEKMVVRPARKLIEPLAKLVPDAVKDFVDPSDMLVSLLNAILRGCCDMVFQPVADRIQFPAPASAS